MNKIKRFFYLALFHKTVEVRMSGEGHNWYGFEWVKATETSPPYEILAYGYPGGRIYIKNAISILFDKNYETCSGVPGGILEIP